MKIIYGAASSGKSSVAEDMAVEAAKKLGEATTLYYMATMETASEAAQERIKRHRAMRAGKGFETIEEMYEPSKHIHQVKGGVVLLECLSNLVANVYWKQYGDGIPGIEEIHALSEQIVDELIQIDQVSQLVIVTNNIFEDGYSQDAWCDAYMQILGLVNRKLAKIGELYEVIAGCTVHIL